MKTCQICRRTLPALLIVAAGMILGCAGTDSQESQTRSQCVDRMRMAWDAGTSYTLERKLDCTAEIPTDDLSALLKDGKAALQCPGDQAQYPNFTFADGPTCSGSHGNLKNWLIDSLQGKDVANQRKAVEIIGMSRKPWVMCPSDDLLEALIGSVASQDQDLQNAALESLTLIAKTNYHHDVSLWKQWMSERQ